MVAKRPVSTLHANLFVKLAWLKSNTITKLVIVIKSRDTREVLERWNFNLDVNGQNGLPMIENIPPEE